MDAAAASRARFRAFHHTAAVALYAEDIGDDELLAECLRSLDVLRQE